MTRNSLPLLLLLGTALTACAAEQPLTQNERNQAMSYLHATRKQFLDAVANVSPAQWNWKPSAQAWSIAEVAEHIALSEDGIFQLVNKTVAGPPATEAQIAETKGKDESMPRMMVDRGRKAQAPEQLKPTKRWKDKASLVAHFKQSRDRNIAYVRDTKDPLRSRVAPHMAFKTLDAYQWMLLISSHSERHTLQLNEVKTMPGFPGK